MNTPQLSIIGALACFLLLIGIVMTVQFEQKQRLEYQNTVLVSPKPLVRHTPTPTPRIPYQPQIPGMSKAAALELFRTYTFEHGLYEGENRLIRWEVTPIPWKFRGQFTKEDERCMSSIGNQLNAALQKTGLERIGSSAQRNGIEIYILPRNQFSSVNPDIRPDDPAQFTYTLSNNRFSSVELLVDLEQPSELRCHYLHELIFRAVGLGIPKTTLAPITRYSDIDLEMFRIMYSPLLTAGLTQIEVERRLLQ